MKNLRKFISLLSFSLALTFLAGCNSGSSKDVGSSSVPTSSSELSSSQTGHTHSPEFVGLVSSTKTTNGVKDHYCCEGCDKLLDSNGNEVSEESLKLPLLAENAIYSEVVQHASYIGVSVYTEKDSITRGLIEGTYVFAVDNEGVVIYASRFGGGYGGPGDGFYHDGAYAPIAGSLCGIFNLYDNWAPWYDGAVEETWNYYDVVVPEGGFIISGLQDDMVDLVKAFIPGLDETAFLTEENNFTFEDLPDGKFNSDKMRLLDGDKYAQVVLERTVLGGVFLTIPSGTVKLTLEDGVYSYIFSLPQYGYISLYTVDDSGAETLVWYNNTTISGAVTGADSFGADWTSRLYHESDRVGNFYSCMESQYKLVYNKDLNTLEFFTVDALYIGGNFEATYYVKDVRSNIVFVAELAQWQGVTISKYDNSFNLVEITHETATFSGDVVDATDDPWDGSLYRDPDNTNKYITGLAGVTSYTFTISLKSGISVNVERAKEGLALGDYRDVTMSVTKQGDSYIATIVASNAWAKFELIYTDSNNASTKIFFDNTIISGDITDVSVEGCSWDGKLYHEGSGCYFRVENPATYTLTYTPAKGEGSATLVVALVPAE